MGVTGQMTRPLLLRHQRLVAHLTVAAFAGVFPLVLQSCADAGDGVAGHGGDGGGGGAGRAGEEVLGYGEGGVVDGGGPLVWVGAVEWVEGV